jgi:hypothetical protein
MNRETKTLEAAIEEVKTIAQEVQEPITGNLVKYVWDFGGYYPDTVILHCLLTHFKVELN